MHSKFRHSKKSLSILLLVSMFATVIYMAPLVKAQSGPRLSKIHFQTIKSPDAQVAAMKLGDVDMYPGLIRPGDVDELSSSQAVWGGRGAKILSTPGGHFCYFTFNLRSTDDDTDGIPEAGYLPHDESKRFLLNVNYRHAMAHIVPKEVLIGTIFKFIVGRVDTVIPPQMGKWHNPDIPKHDYDPGNPFTSSVGDGSAVGALMIDYYFNDADSSGTVTAGDYWAYDAAFTEPLGNIAFLSPSFEEAPTSFTIVSTTANEMAAIGMFNVVHTGITFTVMLDNYVYPQTFDQYFLCWGGLSADPDNIWAFFHSVNDVDHGRNHPGINEPVIDALADIVHTSLNETEVLEATLEAQELLMSDTESYGLSYVTIYSRNYFDAYNPDLTGMINMPLSGSDNGWTFLNSRWNDGVGPHGDNSLVYVLGTDLGSLNPLVANSADEVEVWGMMFDGLDGTNPYTLDDTRGMADYRLIEEYTGAGPVGAVEGMRFSYGLQSGLKWHDGVDFTATDVKFAFDFLNETKPGLWTDAYTDYAGATVVNATYVEIYYNRTSLWLKDTVSGVGALLPKHVWEGHESDWATYEPWEDTTGQPDIPGAPAGTKMTKLVGTGPWIFEKINPAVPEGIVWANPNYYDTQAQTELQLADMFYWFGDVNSDGSVDITDLVLMGLAWGTYPTDGTGRWNDLADLVDDQFIDAEDARVAGSAFGKKKWY